MSKCPDSSICPEDSTYEELCDYCKGWMDGNNFADCGGGYCGEKLCSSCESYEEGKRTGIAEVREVLASMDLHWVNVELGKWGYGSEIGSL